MYIFKSILLLSIAFLTFIEYNTRMIQKEIKTTSLILFFNTFSLILLIVSNFIDSNKIIVKFLIKIAMMSLTVIGNYIITLWIRMIFEKMKSSNDDYGVKLKRNTEDRKSFQINNDTKSNFISKMINYHYNDNNSSVTSSSVSSNTNSKINSEVQSSNNTK